jgi:hypothetical protein
MNNLPAIETDDEYFARKERERTVAVRLLDGPCKDQVIHVHPSAKFLSATAQEPLPLPGRPVPAFVQVYVYAITRWQKGFNEHYTAKIVDTR